METNNQTVVKVYKRGLKWYAAEKAGEVVLVEKEFENWKQAADYCLAAGVQQHPLHQKMMWLKSQ